MTRDLDTGELWVVFHVLRKLGGESVEGNLVKRFGLQGIYPVYQF